MKKVVLIFILIISFCFIENVRAAEYTSRIKIIHNQTNLRPDPGTQRTPITRLSLYDYYTMTSDKLYDDTNNHKNCNGGWYNITYHTGVTGYVCSDDVEVIKSFSKDNEVPTTACEIEMSEAGFPSSYWGGLCKLKADHPTWTFQPIKTNLDWDFVIDEEGKCGKNFIHNSVSDKTFLDTTCTATSPGGYVAPSKIALAYYMDPRNFFTEKYIFQFLDQSYDSTIETVYEPTVKSIVSETAFYKYHLGLENDLAKFITEGSKESGASPIFIASRIYQEMGTKDSLYNLWSGVYEGKFEANEEDKKYLDYYNFFNFGVSDTCVASKGTTRCGLEYAYKSGWKGVSNAIKGGASQLANGYIKKGQYTGYLQKYNVVPTEGTKFTHQYQTNVAAPMTESKTSFFAYDGYNLLGINLIFKIPVYEKMDTTIVNSGDGAVEDDNKGENPSTIPISTIVTSSGYSYTSKYISKIEVGTEVSEIKGVLESVGGNSTVTIYDAKGTILTSGILATGYKIEINNQSSKEVLEVVIKGDTSGDGKINALDLLQVQKNILGTYTLTGPYKEAADTSKDGKINALDLLQVQKDILGTYEIEQ